jgi:hypothetical protein
MTIWMRPEPGVSVAYSQNGSLETNDQNTQRGMTHTRSYPSYDGENRTGVKPSGRASSEWGTDWPDPRASRRNDLVDVRSAGAAAVAPTNVIGIDDTRSQSARIQKPRTLSRIERSPRSTLGGGRMTGRKQGTSLVRLHVIA